MNETLESPLPGNGRRRDDSTTEDVNTTPDEAVARLDLISWLLREGRSFKNAGRMLEALCHQLRARGHQIDRATVGSPLLHPVAQSVFARWDANKGYEENWVRWDADGLAMLGRSPMYPIYTRGESTRWDLTTPGAADRFAIGADLVADGITEYVALALPFPDGTFKAASFATRRQGGFAPETWDMLQVLVPALTVVLEGYVLHRTALTLMETFVGKRAGERVLDGQIARGDGITIRAVVLISDLRGFTELALHESPQALLDLLNTYFGAMTKAIDDAGGEVLKFIGDAVLAVFPVDHSGKNPAPGVTGPSQQNDNAEAKAVAAAEQALMQAHVALNKPDWPKQLEFGIALDIGDVFYGNIGGERRLDFTVIGSSVNRAARIEALCRPLGKRFLASADVAQNSSLDWQSCGSHALKGVGQPVEVYWLP